MVDENYFKMITWSNANRPLLVINFSAMFSKLNLHFGIVACLSILNNCCDICPKIYVGKANKVLYYTL